MSEDDGRRSQTGQSTPISADTESCSSNRRHGDVCVICLDSPRERAVAVPCNHCNFDFLCLASWAQEHATCPLCKTPLTAIEYDWRAPDDYKTFLISSGPEARRQSSNHHSQSYRPRVTRADWPSSYPARPSRFRVNRLNEEVISRRRRIYRQKLYSLHVGSNRISRFRDFTPESFSRSEELQSRARTWIRRELQVFDFVSGGSGASVGMSSNAEFMLSYIMAILKSMDIKSSTGKAEQALGEFLGSENARLFLHELGSWLRSPFAKLDDWDRRVQYLETLQSFKDAEPTPPMASFSHQG